MATVVLVANSPSTSSQWYSNEQTSNSKKSTYHLVDFCVWMFSWLTCFSGQSSPMSIISPESC